VQGQVEGIVENVETMCIYRYNPLVRFTLLLLMTITYGTKLLKIVELYLCVGLAMFGERRYAVSVFL